MNNNNKPSLWQKIKRLLTPSVALSAAAKTPQVHRDSKQPGIKHTSNDFDAHPSETSKNNAQNAKPEAFIDKGPVNKAPINKAPINKSPISKVSINETSINKGTISKANDKANPDNDDAPATNYLKRYLHDKQWHYTYYRPRVSDSQQTRHLSLRMKHKQLDCGYLFRIQEDNGLLALYGILPFLIPESHQSAAMLLIAQINYDMLIGNLEMDVNDGEIRYKNAIDIRAVGMDDPIIEHLLQSVIAMTTVAYELFSDLINTQDPAQDMPTLLGELRQQADDRTFFLPTQFVQ
ncbi:hypothetical protein RCH20_000385 [Psychrobacter sp. PL15]|uniref:YbjN domain-containing protein n=1 Tax=Psychrobacter sp. PL15 TaxID=3071719 RepID=UPI002DFD90D9|nr:hypothetical protein [Psychrobacter sp. PL15]